MKKKEEKFYKEVGALAEDPAPLSKKEAKKLQKLALERDTAKGGKKKAPVYLKWAAAAAALVLVVLGGVLFLQRPAVPMEITASPRMASEQVSAEDGQMPDLAKAAAQYCKEEKTIPLLEDPELFLCDVSFQNGGCCLVFAGEKVHDISLVKDGTDEVITSSSLPVAKGDTPMSLIVVDGAKNTKALRHYTLQIG